MKRVSGSIAVLAILASASPLLAADALPPWTDAGDVPIPTWVRSVIPTRAESAMYTEPGRTEARRGSAQPGARFPLYATRRANGCMGRWLNVGPLAWMCSDVAEYSTDEPGAPALGTRPWSETGRPGARGLPSIEPLSQTDDGLPYRYYFAGRDGASGFANLETAGDDAPDQDLEAGFAVALLEERSARGEKWGKTKKGRWVAMRELVPTRPNLFHGELVADAKLDFGWVIADKANVYASEKVDKPSATRVRFEKVTILEEKPGKDGGVVKVAGDLWMRGRDLSRPHLMPPPPELRTESERWIDVDLGQQALVAYEGKKPVFATIISSGKGPPGSELATHPGTFRIWVKLFTTKMDNLDKDEADRHYAIEDVPWVQFFDKAIALHGAFWHHDFGRMHSHGCVNMAPLDARWVFAFTSPHLPSGWSAVLPTKVEEGAVVRVR